MCVGERAPIFLHQRIDYIAHHVHQLQHTHINNVKTIQILNSIKILVVFGSQTREAAKPRKKKAQKPRNRGKRRQNGRKTAKIHSAEKCVYFLTPSSALSSRYLFSRFRGFFLVFLRVFQASFPAVSREIVAF